MKLILLHRTTAMVYLTWLTFLLFKRVLRKTFALIGQIALERFILMVFRDNAV